MRPGGALGPEPAADVHRDDAHQAGRQAEDRGDRIPVGGRSLGGVEDDQAAALVPEGQGGVRFHRVVVLHRGGVGDVHPGRRAGQPGLDVAVAGHRGEARVDLVRRVQAGMSGPQAHVMRLGVAPDPDRLRRRAGLLQRVGHHRGDQLPAVADLAGGEQGQLGVPGRPELRRVGAGQHREHAGHGERGDRVDGPDATAGDRCLHRVGVGRAGDPGAVQPGVFVGVLGAAGHLVPSFDAVHCDSSSRVAAIRLRASVTL